MSDWISVKDRLPDVSKTNGVVDVIAFGSGCNCRKLSYIQNAIEGGNFYFEFLGLFENFTRNVTHWMPLPEPPKQ